MCIGGAPLGKTKGVNETRLLKEKQKKTEKKEIKPFDGQSCSLAFEPLPRLSVLRHHPLWNEVKFIDRDPI